MLLEIFQYRISNLFSVSLFNLLVNIPKWHFQTYHFNVDESAEAVKEVDLNCFCLFSSGCGCRRQGGVEASRRPIPSQRNARLSAHCFHGWRHDLHVRKRQRISRSYSGESGNGPQHSWPSLSQQVHLNDFLSIRSLCIDVFRRIVVRINLKYFQKSKLRCLKMSRHVPSVKVVLRAPIFWNFRNFGTKWDTTKKLKSKSYISWRSNDFISCFSCVYLSVSKLRRCKKIGARSTLLTAGTIQSQNFTVFF